MTLFELIIACSILLVLSSAALPVLKYTVIRSKEYELRRDLREIRDAFDRYKDTADRGLIRIEIGSEGYPPDLETLVKGVNMGSKERVPFLRRIPKDPMTGGVESLAFWPQSEPRFKREPIWPAGRKRNADQTSSMATMDTERHLAALIASRITSRLRFPLTVEVFFG